MNYSDLNRKKLYPEFCCLYLCVIMELDPYSNHFLTTGADFNFASIPSFSFSQILGTPKNNVGLTAFRFSRRVPCEMKKKTLNKGKYFQVKSLKFKGSRDSG